MLFDFISTSFVKNIICDQGLEPVLSKLYGDLPPMISGVVSNMKKNVANAVAEKLSLTVLILNGFVQVKFFQYEQRLFIVYVINILTILNGTDFPNTKWLLLFVDSIVPDLMSVQHMVIDSYSFLGSLIRIVVKNVVQFLVEMMTVFE